MPRQPRGTELMREFPVQSLAHAQGGHSALLTGRPAGAVSRAVDGVEAARVELVPVPAAVAGDIASGRPDGEGHGVEEWELGHTRAVTLRRGHRLVPGAPAVSGDGQGIHAIGRVGEVNADRDTMLAPESGREDATAM